MSTPQSESAILKSLNQAQRRAVTSNAPTVAILAGPGSGKTHTLTSRVVWLVQQTGYQPSDIIVATFTVKAAREMKERIGKTLGSECEKKIVLGTFHSIARRYLATYGRRIGLDSKFAIADDGDSRAIIQRICKRLDLNIEPSHARSWISKKKSKGEVPAAPTKNGKQPSENPALKVCFKEYQEHLARANLLDYDDLLVRCVELLKEHPSCVANVQSVLIDEYQDTNGIQYELMRLFAQARQRITIVGDPDQSIYGWRSAEIRNLYRLLRDFPETDEISLQENYRSSQSILDVSLHVIQQDKKRYQKVLLPVHTKGARPVLRKLKSSSAEGDWIISEIKRAVMMLGGMIKYGDIAILLRSASLSRHIESALGKSGIAYRMIGGHKFYERKEIKVLLDYLRVVHQPDNNDAISRIINVPRRGIGETTVKRLLEEAEIEKISLWSLLCNHCRGKRNAATKILPKMEQKLNTELLRIITSLRNFAQKMVDSSSFTLVDLIEQLIAQLDFKKYLEAEYVEDHEQRWANVQELINLAGDFMRDLGKLEDDALPEIENLDQVNDQDVLGKFLANVALASDAQKDGKVEDKTALVTISTIHAAKGLEWPVVFVPAVYSGSIPHSRAEDLDEERRLLYVAMTRAQALLYLSCPLYGSLTSGGNRVELSPFVSPFASKAFAQKGPSFDRAILEGVGKIIGRDIPSEKEVFGKIPPMFAPEDDMFPVEPIDPKNPDEFDVDQPGLDVRAGRPPKRQRMSYNNFDGPAEERPWQKDYATTMEQSSSFTVSSLPGFTSATTHKMTLAAAAQAEAAEKKTRTKPGIKSGTTRRKPDQSSLLGFVKPETKTPAMPPGKAGVKDLSLARYQAAASRSAARSAAAISVPQEVPKPAIEPTLAQHKILSGKSLGPPKLKYDDSSKKEYSCFSSSPTRPSAPEKSTTATAAAADEQSQAAPAPALARPATSFHATTFLSANPKGGMRRPVGLGPAPSMDRLRKPFKPLTINRPSGPTR